MKSELANKLKTVLDNMSQEQFDKEWSAITTLNLEGPSFSDAIEYFSISQSQNSNFELISSVASKEFFIENNYYKAA